MPISGRSISSARSAPSGIWSNEAYTTPVHNYLDFQGDNSSLSSQNQVQRPLTPPYGLHDQHNFHDFPTKNDMTSGRIDCLESLLSLGRPDEQVAWTSQNTGMMPSPLDFEPDLGVIPRGAIDSLPLPSIPPIPSQLLPNLITTGTVVSPDLALSPVGMVAAATGPVLPEATIQDDDDEDDPEGIRAVLCRVPTIDKNVKDNALPFVLHSYSQWAIARFFEPLKIVHSMRDQVFTQFSSQESRSRVIMIANVMDMFAKKLSIDDTRKSVLNHLASDVQKSSSSFKHSSLALAPVSDRENASRTLDSVLEIFALRACTQSIAAVIELLDYAAPIFRRACPDPPGESLNLPNLLQSPNHNLRYFAYMDVIASVTTGRPTYFRYEVPLSLELCHQMYRWELAGNCGLQWLNGFSSQFILLFAWINTLSETPGAGDDVELLAWIEANLPRVKLAIDLSGDPLLRIGRTVVQECWRLAVQIYLYLVLCKANAYDPRVMRAQKGFMRLIKGVKPARNPDAYLLNLIAIAGVATIEERDRATLRQRILGVHEYAERGTTGNEVVLMLEDVWTRTRNEGRAAVWSDLRIACFRVTGR